MKQIIPIALTIALLIPSAFAADEAQPALAGPDVNAESVALLEQETGTLLLGKNETTQYEPASVTKIMTMLLVMEALQSGQITRDETVTVSANAAGMGGSQVYLKENEQMDVWTLLKCVCVASGNDASVALAEHICGSEQAFVQRMNERANELGMTNTHFENCTGLPAPGHLTTAYDIALMSRALMLNHPEIQELTTIWMDTIRDGSFGLSNTNRLIRFYPGATGLKTGSTDSALYCLSATAERDGMNLIAVVLKGPTSNDRFEAAKTLLDYGFANFAVTSVYPDTPIMPVDVILGTSTQIQPVLSRECRLLIPKGQEEAISTRITLATDVEAPVEAGQTLGTMEVYLDNILQDSIPIIAQNGIERLGIGDIFSRMFRKLLVA